MKKEWLIKILALVIVLLFMGSSSSPIIECLPNEKQPNQESLPTSIKNNSGISLITLKVTGVTGGDNWYGSDNSFTFTYESSEIAKIYYAIDGNYLLYNGTFNVAEGGNHALEWYAVDYGGNQSEVDGPFYFKIDKTSPNLQLQYTINNANYRLGLFEIGLKAIADDSMSGMNYVEFYVNDVWQETVTVSQQPYYWFFWINPEIETIATEKAFDIAGNLATDSCEIVGPWKSQNFFDEVISSEIIEREINNIYEKPKFSISSNGIFDPAYVIVVFNRKMGENDWIDSNVSLSIFYESDRISKVSYQLNNGSWILYNDSLLINEDGNYVFSWYANDSEGNSSTPESMAFKVDLTSPELNMTRKRLSFNKVRFIADVYDNTSGVDRIRFHGEYGSDFIDYDNPFEWIWNGSSLTEKVTVTVYDKAGNKISRTVNTRVGLCYDPKIVPRFSHVLFFHFFRRSMYI